MRVLAVAIVVWLVLGVPGCRRREIVSGVSDSTYVRVMIALRRLPQAVLTDTVPRARMRDSVLRTFGVTAAQLESAAVRLARDPERAAALWQAIQRGATGQAR